MKSLALVCLLCAGAAAVTALPQSVSQKKQAAQDIKSNTRTVPLPLFKANAHFTHRDAMQARGVFRAFKHAAPIIPATTLPVDCTGNATVSCPMDGNDQYGDCGPAMCCHVDNIWTFGQGKTGWTESVFSQTNIVSQYLQISGGDNGTNEAMLVGSGGIWRTGLAGIPAAIVVDALDIDVTNVPLAQFAIDNFYSIQMAWSVPDAFINGFNTGTVWSSAGVPDPNNGHYTPLSDIGGPQTSSGNMSLNGYYRLWTWGTWCWVSPQFVASVQPQCFIAFSPRQFSAATGLDSKGRHITTQAAIWQQCGGHAIPPAVLNAFPPLVGPAPPSPVPTPTPTPPSSSTLFTFTPRGNVTAGGSLTVRNIPVPLTAGQEYGVITLPAPPVADAKQ
jgi:hypothetical protein